MSATRTPRSEPRTPKSGRSGNTGGTTGHRSHHSRLRVLEDGEISPVTRQVITWAFAVGVDRACSLIAGELAETARGGQRLTAARLLALRDQLLAGPLILVVRDPDPEPQDEKVTNQGVRNGPQLNEKLNGQELNDSSR
jgi:hypothetical protein